MKLKEALILIDVVIGMFFTFMGMAFLLFFTAQLFMEGFSITKDNVSNLIAILMVIYLGFRYFDYSLESSRREDS